jgi:hypothetical protein
MVKFRRFQPPLSSGPGRSPLKAETRVRTSLGAQEIRPERRVFDFYKQLGFLALRKNVDSA